MTWTSRAARHGLGFFCKYGNVKFGIVLLAPILHQPQWKSGWGLPPGGKKHFVCRSQKVTVTTGLFGENYIPQKGQRPLTFIFA
jgi:hypothetical protein